MPLFTKHHYEAIAKTIRLYIRFPGKDEGTETDFFIRTLADSFAEDNPKFNRSKFMQACGITSA